MAITSVLDWHDVIINLTGMTSTTCGSARI